MGHSHGTRVYVDVETDIALFRVDGSVLAVTNVCPHKHEATIHAGVVYNGTVTCPMHGWCFELQSGRNVGIGAGLTVYSVIERDGYVWLDISDPAHVGSAVWKDASE